MLHELIQHFKSLDFTSHPIGLENGISGISLFFFYYSRYTNNDKEEDYAYYLLEKVLYSPDIGKDLSYSTGLSGIGCFLNFLVKERFLCISSENVFKELDTTIVKRIKNYSHWDYSFQTGLVGLCRYVIQRNIYMEVISTALDILAERFNNKGTIESLFLFPSEVLTDVQLLLAELTNKRLFNRKIKDILVLIDRFKKDYSILQSNCTEYYIFQRLRKSMIENDYISINKELENLSKNKSLKIWKGLAFMSLNNPQLPAWWKII